jgi:ferric-dicitrate binding protein FerR (iron transport regulator)
VQQDPELTGEERAELERLRAEVARLRATAPAAAPERPPGRQRWRTAVASLLIVVGCVLAPLSAVAVWTRNQVTDTDR